MILMSPKVAVDLQLISKLANEYRNNDEKKIKMKLPYYLMLCIGNYMSES